MTTPTIDDDTIVIPRIDETDDNMALIAVAREEMRRRLRLTTDHPDTGGVDVADAVMRDMARFRGAGYTAVMYDQHDRPEEIAAVQAAATAHGLMPVGSDDAPPRGYRPAYADVIVTLAAAAEHIPDPEPDADVIPILRGKTDNTAADRYELMPHQHNTSTSRVIVDHVPYEDCDLGSMGERWHAAACEVTASDDLYDTALWRSLADVPVLMREIVRLRQSAVVVTSQAALDEFSTTLQGSLAAFMGTLQATLGPAALRLRTAAIDDQDPKPATPRRTPRKTTKAAPAKATSDTPDATPASDTPPAKTTAERRAAKRTTRKTTGDQA